MIYPDGHTYLTQPEYCDELIPALKDWDDALSVHGVERMNWFLFGSVVVKDKAGENPIEEDAAQALAAAMLGSRPSKRFKPSSDIDVGLVVADGDDEIELHQYDPKSLFRSTRVAGHALALTRFERSWAERRYSDLSQMKIGTPILGFYGKIVPVELG